jgi:hypothetical protein
MRRLLNKRYNLYASVLMAIYVALVGFVFPYARHADSVAVRAALAGVCALPVIAVIWLMLLRVIHSDELEQRLHLMAMSTSTGIVAAVSLVGGFLNSAHVLRFDGDVLIWVFPALCLCYGIAQLVFARRYGGTGCG